MGECDQSAVEGILDFFYDQGGKFTELYRVDKGGKILTQIGNFIDTSNNYQFQESEKWIGEWMKKRGVRDQMGSLSPRRPVLPLT